jgi:hypothetical protein
MAAANKDEGLEDAAILLMSLGADAAAMRADIVECLDLIGGRADDDDAVVANVVSEEVADIGKVLEAARHLPDARPQLLPLGLGIIAREESLGPIGDSNLVIERLGGDNRVPGHDRSSMPAKSPAARQSASIASKWSQP